MSMNIECYERLKELLCSKIGPTDPSSFEDKALMHYGNFFTQKFLIGVYNSNRTDFENSEFLLASCFFAGIVTNLIYKTVDKNDIENVSNLQSVLELNLFCTEELLKTSIDVLGSVGWLVDIENQKEILLQQFLTHQININENSLQEVLTILYTVFMVSVSLELQ